MKVDIDNLSFSIQSRRLIEDINLHVASGQMVGIVGPNGSGKSTLLKNMSRIHTPDDGRVELDDHDIFHISSKALARMLAMVGQDASGQFEFSVKEIALMGRAPHKKLLETDTALDERLVMQALERVGMAGFEARSVTTLSGGERQRVLLARALVQDADVLVLDEPTNHLDVHHQLQLLDLVRELKITSVAALHDLNLAASYCDRIYVIQNGRIVACGTPEEVLTETLLRDVFRVNTHIMRHHLTGKTHITYLSSVADEAQVGPPENNRQSLEVTG